MEETKKKVGIVYDRQCFLQILQLCLSLVLLSISFLLLLVGFWFNSIYSIVPFELCSILAKGILLEVTFLYQNEIAFSYSRKYTFSHCFLSLRSVSHSFSCQTTDSKWTKLARIDFVKFTNRTTMNREHRSRAFTMKNPVTCGHTEDAKRRRRKLSILFIRLCDTSESDDFDVFLFHFFCFLKSISFLERRKKKIVWHIFTQHVSEHNGTMLKPNLLLIFDIAMT